MTAANPPPPHTAADYYSFFLEGVRDILADVESAKMDPAGTLLLRQALTRFEAEFRRRHPAAAAAASSATARYAPQPPLWHVLAALSDDAWASQADEEGIALMERARMLLWP